MNAARLYMRYIGISIRGQLQYPASSIMQAIGQFIVTVKEFGGILILFHRFGSLRSWRLAEIGLFYGLIFTAFALTEAVGRGFDRFSNLVRTGDFDRLLLRPRSVAFQVSCLEWQISRVGRLSTSVPVLIWATIALGVDWTVGRVALLLFTLLGGMCLFYGLFVLQATLAFWTIESLEVMNTVTDGGRETGQYPLSIYRPWFRKFFTFVVPLACVTYFPALAILGRTDEAIGSPLWFQCAAPLIGVAFLPIALQVWRFGVRHYSSTGS